MKKFFEQYGGVALGILALLVLIAMITPVGNIIKTSLQGTVNKFSGSMHEQLGDAMNATASAQNSASGFETNLAPSPEAPVVPGTPTPNPGTEKPVVPPMEPVTPENYNGYVTEPGTYFFDMLCRNQDQPSGKFPFPYCLNYEINVLVGNRWTGWFDDKKPGYDETGVDSEMVTFDITQEMLDEANGKIYLNWSIQAAMYGSTLSIEEIGQPLKVRVGRIEADDSQIILKCSPYNGASTCS